MELEIRYSTKHWDLLCILKLHLRAQQPLVLESRDQNDFQPCLHQQCYASNHEEGTIRLLIWTLFLVVGPLKIKTS